MKTLKVLPGLLVLVASLFSGCFPGTITGSGSLTSQEFSVNDCTTLHIQNGCNIDVTQADSFSIEVTADENIMEFVEVFKENDSLVIRLKPTRTYGGVTLRAVITMPELRTLELSGGSQATLIDFVSGQSLTVQLSGGSRAEGTINVGDVDFNLSGGSHAAVSGTGKDMSINASGGSNLKLADFLVEDADVNLSGGSDADINPSGNIDSNVSGSSSLSVRGQPYP